MLLSRAQFAQHWNSIRSGLADEGQPLWAPERQLGPRNWFVCTAQIDVFDTENGDRTSDRTNYWNWCTENLSDYPICYSSSYEDNTEWWGFSTQEDIVRWMLRWR